jgi:hypothetical protein
MHKMQPIPVCFVPQELKDLLHSWKSIFVSR